MSVHHATARKLATEAEWTLLQASRASEITALTPARLTQKIARTRKLRDKYRDLAKQQRGEARGKRNAKSTRAAEGNENTVIKQQMFAEALERFEERLEKVTAKTETKAKTKPKAKSSPKAKATPKTKAKASPKAKATPKTKAKVSPKEKTTPARGNGVRPHPKAEPKDGSKTADADSPPPAASGAHIWGREAQATATAKQAQSEESRGSRKAQKLNHQSAEAHQGHVGARGRRNQARRDSK